MEHSHEKLTRYLQDLHAAEQGLEEILKGHLDDERVPMSVRQVCSQAVQGTRTRMALLDQNLNRLGGGTSTVKDFVNKAATVISDLWNSGHEPVDKITMDLIKGHAAAHLIHASYFALRSYSEACGDATTLDLADQGLRDSAETAKSFLPVIGEIAGAATVTTR